jgi:hypothetical protein
VADAPFGVVTLAASGGEGGADISTMRVAQAGGYGILPNAAMPNTFLAHAYDLSDPFGNISCYKMQCCSNNFNPNNTAQTCHGCWGAGNYCEVGDATNFYMGPIHPRTKKPVGLRLAQASAAVAYKKKVAFTGPTLAGCTKAGSKITLTFNTTLLGAGGGIAVQNYSRVQLSSMLDVLVNKSAWCMQIQSHGKKLPNSCWDDGYGHQDPVGPAYDVQYKHPMPCTKQPIKEHCPCGAGGCNTTAFAWMPVDITLGTAPGTVIADLSNSGGVAYAVRYAFAGGGNCCYNRPASSAPCEPASCPLMGSGTEQGLPANPFVAQITAAGKCACIPPVVCDA